MLLASGALSLVGADFWWLGGFALLVSTALGFFAGYQTALGVGRRAEVLSRRTLPALFTTAIKTLDSAAELCNLLERRSGRMLSGEQSAKLQERQSKLSSMFHRLLGHAEADETALVPCGEVSPSAAEAKIRVRWTLTPVDPISGLPDREPFDANLAALLEAGRKAQQASSLLIIRVDKLQSLASRLGPAGVHTLQRKLAAVICRTVRDEDLVCQLGPDLMGVLLVGSNFESGSRMARAVRDQVRSHRFRIDENGPEVLVTASFGFAACHPDDRGDLVLDRAAAALSKSQRCGRNQLHLHDGVAVTQTPLSA